MIRTVITADKNTLILPLPDNYIGRQLEIIAFAIDEPVKQTKRASAKDVFKALKFDTRGFKFNRDEANSR
ncbi:MAG TPA: hypothetical protein PK252_14735 [Bacteroidales bacterium]|nr:hypothetical protein [Bacteroidales bacterium]